MIKRAASFCSCDLSSFDLIGEMRCVALRASSGFASRRRVSFLRPLRNSHSWRNETRRIAPGARKRPPGFLLPVATPEPLEPIRMPRMPLSELKAMLAAEKADALAAVSASKLSHERADAMDYYLGEMARDMPAADGRSSAVSTDVADTIEGLMPALMEIFCAGDEVVRFEPVGPEDVAAAEQETDYVNHVFTQVNPGFLILYSFIKDALLSKVGIVKVWWETRTLEERETYYDLTDDAFS